MLAAAAVQGVIFRTVRVTVDRYGAIGWRYLTGTWPGEKRPDPDELITKPRSESVASAFSKPAKSRASSRSSGRPFGPATRSHLRSPLSS